MRSLFSTLFLLLVTLIIVTTEAGKNKKDKGKGAQGASDCVQWLYGTCKANNGDCGPGVREGTCNDKKMKMKCKVPCNWKKEFGADCKYKFDNWSECDSSTRTKSRSGNLVKPLYNIPCNPSITISVPCGKKRANGKKGKGRGN